MANELRESLLRERPQIHLGDRLAHRFLEIALEHAARDGVPQPARTSLHGAKGAFAVPVAVADDEQLKATRLGPGSQFLHVLPAVLDEPAARPPRRDPRPRNSARRQTAQQLTPTFEAGCVY